MLQPDIKDVNVSLLDFISSIQTFDIPKVEVEECKVINP